MAEREEVDHQVTGVMANGPTSINELPDEMLVKVFSYLSVEDIGLSIQYVCTHWSHLCTDYALWKGLFFNIEPDMSVDYISSVLQNVPQLQCVEVLKPTAEIVHKVAVFCTDLRKLKVPDIDVSWDTEEDDLEALQHLVKTCMNLEELDIPGTALCNEELAACVGQLTNLRALSLTGLSCDGPVNLKHIADGCPSLQQLYMHYMMWYYADLKYFIEQKKNKLLNFGTIHLSVEGTFVFPLLAMCQNSLRELILIVTSSDSGTYIDEPTFSVIKTLTSLTSLKIYSPNGLTPDVLANIFVDGAMSQLSYLEIRFSPAVNARVVNTLCDNCPNLLRLGLSFCHHLDNSGLKNLHKCANLEQLELIFCSSLTDGVMDHIVRCTKLKSLKLVDCRLTGVGVERTLLLSELRHLELSYCDVAGLCFDIFPLHLKNLTTLILNDCVNLDSESLDVVRAQMPHLKVFL